jgi:hypothetical protein
MRSFTFQTRALCAIAAAVVVGVASWWIFAQQSPAPGQRSFSSQYVWAIRCAFVAAMALTHAILFGWALPAVYRARSVYAALAFASMTTAILAGVTAGGLALAVP